MTRSGAQGRSDPFRQPWNAALAVLFGIAVTLSMYVPEPAIQRALQGTGIVALLPSLGWRRFASNALSAWRPADWLSAAYFAALLTLSAFAIDPAVYAPHVTPKLYVVLLISATGVLGFALTTAVRPRGTLRITVIDLLLMATLAWGFVANPRWLAGPTVAWFWPTLAAVLVTLLTRQLFSPTDTGTPGPDPSRRQVAAGDFLCALWINGVVLAILGLRQAYDAGAFRYESGDFKTPMISTIGYPNGFGAFMAAGIIASVFAALEARTRFVRALLGAAALLQLVALLGNGSRGALLGLLTSALLSGWLFLLTRAARREHSGEGGARFVMTPSRRAALAASGLGVVLVLAATAGVLYRMNPDSGRGRLIAWEVSAAMVLDHPATGIGTGRYAAEYGRYQAELWRHPEYARWDRQALDRPHPNSEYVHVAAERGIPGLVLFVGLWGCALAYLLRSLLRSSGTSRMDWALLALLLATLSHAAVDGALHWLPTLMMAHLALGLVAAPALLQIPLQPRAIPPLLVLLAGSYTFAVAVKTWHEYPAYQRWMRSAGEFGEAEIESLTAAHVRLPPDRDLDQRLGTALLAAGRPESAVGVLERALDDHDVVDIRLALAQAQYELGRLEPAERHARTVLARLPDRLRPQLLLARIHYAANEHAQARAALARCIRRETSFRSSAVDAVMTEARALWQEWYDDEPPE